MAEQNNIFTDEGWDEFQEYLDFLPEDQRTDFLNRFVKFICGLTV
jgi:hypothetical protein